MQKTGIPLIREHLIRLESILRLITRFVSGENI